jgi:regulator of cell morphogenesis and NO signaling
MNREISIGEIVTADFRAAEIFREAGIDFCCGGKKNLDQACSEKGIDVAEMEARIDNLGTLPEDTAHNFSEWDLGFLSDYIINTHHKYVIKTLPELVYYTTKIAAVHGENHPELTDVANLFAEINKELLSHLRTEEERFFPALKEYLLNGSEQAGQTLAKLMQELSSEHESAGGAMDRICDITKSYTVPADGCNTYHLTFKLLKQFEDDLHVHVHLENNIIFPKLKSKLN